MYNFELPFWNISDCSCDRNEQRLIEWLMERSEYEKHITRTINKLEHGYTIAIPCNAPRWDEYWNLNVPGFYDLIHIEGTREWSHYRISRFEVDDHRSIRVYDDLQNSRTFFSIADEYLALQFKLVL